MEKSHSANEMIRAEKILRSTLAILDLPIRASYRSGEVCKILGIGEATFWRMIKAYRRDEKGQLLRPDALESFMIVDNRRVTYVELVDYLRRNNASKREVTG